MSEGHDVKKEVRIYLTVFFMLMFLTVVTVAVSYLKVSMTVAILIALAIALVKASLVACYFMHLIDEKKLIYVILTFAILCFAGLLYIPVTETYIVPEGTQHLEHIYNEGKPAELDHHSEKPADDHSGGEDKHHVS